MTLLASDLKPALELRYGGPWSAISANRGFSLIELLMVTALVGIVSVIGLPLLGQISGAIELGEAARQVERELQSARMTAVSANQPMRVMFNCPVGRSVPDGRADRNAGRACGRRWRRRPMLADDVSVSRARQQPDYAGRTTTVRCATSRRR